MPTATSFSTPTASTMVRHWRAYCAERCIVRVRREARCRIPGAARRNLEECSWVTQLTWRRKPKGTIACWESGGGPKTLSGWVPQGPRAMVNA
jgi:hypothetical protein